MAKRLHPDNKVPLIAKLVHKVYTDVKPSPYEFPGRLRHNEKNYQRMGANVGINLKDQNQQRREPHFLSQPRRQSSSGQESDQDEPGRSRHPVGKQT